ncbi:MAG: STAS domain-containing protein [Gaiellales bacterium]
MYGVVLSWYDTDIAVVTLLGEHDFRSKDELAEALRAPLVARDLLVVDLSETELIDSSVIQNLFEIHCFAWEQGLKVALQVDPESHVTRVLESAGVTRSVPCAETRDGAAALARLDDYLPSAGGENRRPRSYSS